MTNKEARLKLQILYGCRCMLTGIESEYLSYHHIEKKEHSGKTNINNGANLLTAIHRWLHNDIEHNDIELFYLINECLKLYKMCIDLGLTDLTNQYEEEVMPEYRRKVIHNENKKGKRIAV